MRTALACTRCGTPIAAGQRFCSACGAPVVGECGSCGGPVTAETRFCPQCGAAVSLQSGPRTPPFGPSDTPAGEPTAGDTPPAPTGGLALVSWRQVAAHLQAALRGEFTIEREIGRGGMAAVYLARERRLNRWVALKVMSPSLLSGHGMVERFQQEAVTVANLQHANIVTVHAVRDLEDLHFFVMQFVDGRALDRILADARQLPLAAVRSILFQVGSALSYAHRRGVIHRDIKPANILIDRAGDAIVTDFGIAKVAESSAHTQTGMLIGTPTYMSPEQCLGTPVSAASDQYALGVVAYELLAGRVPFTGPSLSVLQAQITQPPPPLEQFAPDCPPDVVAAVMRMLAKNPADRWPTIGQAVAALGGGPLGEEDPLRDTLATMAAGPVAAPPAPPPPPTPVAAVVEIELPAGDWEPGDTVPATAIVVAGDGTPMPDAGLRWESTTPDVAEVDAETGLITLRAPGDAVVQATSGPARGEATLAVHAVRARAIEVAAHPEPFRAAESWQPIVTVLDRRGATLDVPVAVETDAPEIAAVGDERQIEALMPGTVRVRFSVDDVAREVALTIAPPAVATLTLEPASRQLEVGERVRCDARAQDRIGRPMPDVTMRWRSSDPRVATVDEAGLVTGVAPGSVTISVHAEPSDRRTGTQLAVRPAAVASLELGPAPAPLRPGERVRLGAVARDRRGQTLDRRVRWTSGAPEIVSVDATGLAEAHTPGSATVTVECEGQRETVTLDVMVASVTELFVPAPPPAPAAPPPVVEPEVVAAPVEPPAQRLDVHAQPTEEVARVPIAPAAPVTPVVPPRESAPVEPPPAPAPVPRPTPTPAVAAVPVAPPTAEAARPRRSGVLVLAVAAAAIVAAAGWWLVGRDDATTQPAVGAPEQGAPSVAPPVSTPPAPAPGPAPAPTPASSKPSTPAPAPSAAPTRPAVTPPGPKSTTPPPRGTTSPARGATGSARPPAPAARPESPRTAPTTTTATTDRPVEPAPIVPAPVVTPTPAPTTTREPVTPPVEAPAASNAAAAASEARAGMQRAIGAYVDAIGARNVGAMQRAFPTMPSSVRKGWEQLFGAVKNVEARAVGLQIGPPDGDAGTAEFGLAVSYPNSITKRQCTLTTQFRMRLVRAGSAWHIADQTQLGSTQSPGCG